MGEGHGHVSIWNKWQARVEAGFGMCIGVRARASTSAGNSFAGLVSEGALNPLHVHVQGPFMRAQRCREAAEAFARGVSVILRCIILGGGYVYTSAGPTGGLVSYLDAAGGDLLPQHYTHH